MYVRAGKRRKYIDREKLNMKIKKKRELIWKGGREGRKGSGVEVFKLFYLVPT